MSIKKWFSTLGSIALAAMLVVLTLPAAVLAAPLPPGNLAATVAPGPVVVLTWTDTANETGFRVMRSLAPSDNFTQVGADTLADVVTFTDTTVVVGNTYNYQVVAFNADATPVSPPSNTVQVTVTGVPTISLVTPAGASPQLRGGDVNPVQVNITSPGTTIQSAEWQVVNNVGIAQFDALEVFAQVAPPVPFAGASNNNLVINGAAEVAAALPNARILFVIFGNINSGNTTGNVDAVWSVGSPAINVNIPAGTDTRGAVIGNTVRLVGERALAANTPIMIEAVAVRPAAANDLTVENAFLFNGAVTAIGVSPGGETQWTVADNTTVPTTVGVFNVGAAAIDAGFGLPPDNPVVTVEFGLAAVPAGLPTPPAMSALEIFAQVVSKPPRAANPVPDTRPVSIEVPNGTEVLMVIFGVVSAVDRTTGIWQIGSPPVFVHESAGTVVRDFPLRGGVDDAPAVGDGIGRLVASRSLASGPIVAEVIVGDGTEGQTPGPVTMETAYLFNGTVTATTATTWTVTPAAGGASATFDITGAGIDPGLGLAPNNPVVTVEFGVSGGAPLLSNEAWAPLTRDVNTGLWQATMPATELPAVTTPQGAWIYVRTTDAVGTPAITVFPTTLAVVPVPPTSVTAVIVAGPPLAITLNWADVAGETGYRVEHADNLQFTNAHIHITSANITTVSDTVLPNTTHHFRVFAVNNNIDSIPSNTVTVTVAAPPAVTGLAAVPASSTQVNLNWTDTTSETSYRVERSTSTNFTAPLVLGTLAAGATAFSDTSATAASTFFYRIVAINAIDQTPSAPVSATTPAAPTTVPAAPTGLNVVVFSSTRIDLTWVDTSNDEQEFRIERAANDTFTPVAASFTVPAGVNNASATVAGAGPFFFRVFANNVVGDSASPAGPLQVTVAAPAAPSGLTATAVSSTAVNLAWTDNSTGESGFTIRRATDAAFTVNLVEKTALANATTFSDTGLTASTQYFYQIAAVNGVDTSAFVASTPASVTTPAPPPPPPASSGGGGGGTVTAPPTTSSVSLTGLTGSGLTVDTSGATVSSVALTTSDGKATINIAAGTVMKNASGNALTSLSLDQATAPAPPPQGAVVVNYNFGPEGATFSPAITIDLTYDETTIPAGANESDLYAAFWDGSQWVKLESTVNADTNTISAKVAHFTNIAVISAPPPAPPPAPIPVPEPVVTPPPPAPAVEPVVTPAPLPTVTIVSPAPGATLPSGDVTVTIETSNIKLVDLGQSNVSGEGHLHYYLDVAIPVNPGQPAVTAAGTYQAVNALSATWQDLAPGTHTLGVQLVNNDHTPLAPPVTASVTITVVAPAPVSQPTAPVPQPQAPPAPAANPAPMIWGIILAAVAVVFLAVIFLKRRSRQNS